MRKIKSVMSMLTTIQQQRLPNLNHLFSCSLSLQSELEIIITVWHNFHLCKADEYNFISSPK